MLHAFFASGSTATRTKSRPMGRFADTLAGAAFKLHFASALAAALAAIVSMGVVSTAQAQSAPAQQATGTTGDKPASGTAQATPAAPATPPPMAAALNKPVEIYVSGGYLAADFKASRAIGNWGMVGTLRGGVTLSDRFTIGLAYSQWVTPADNEYTYAAQPGSTSLSAPFRFNMSYGGLLLEPTFRFLKWLNLSIPVIIGGGYADMTPVGIVPTGYTADSITTAAFGPRQGGGFFITEAGGTFDFKAYTWFKIGVGGTFRVVAGWRQGPYTGSDLTEVSAGLTFKFGQFE